jgi:predicted amidohydrolase YtcJ
VVHTLDPALPAAAAVAVAAGRVVAVGSDRDVASWIGPATRVIQLRGRTLVPGLIDSHLHLASLGARRSGVELADTRSIAEARARVKAAVAAAGRGEWIVGRGWDQNRWGNSVFPQRRLRREDPNSAFPTAADLDQVSPGNPVVLRRVDGHAIWTNSRAMQLAGVDAATRSPAGGEVVRIDGRPSGVFVDNAMELVESKVPPPTRAQLRAALDAAQRECLAQGLVQVADMGVGGTELELLRELDAAGELRLRVQAYLDGAAPDLAAQPGRGPGGGARLTVRGVKLFVDGALGSRGALLGAPYADDAGTSGLLLTRPDLLEARMRAADAAGLQVATHAIGDRGNRIVLDLYQRIFGQRAREARPRVEHAQVLAAGDVARFGKFGVIASMQPTHATSDMPWAERRLGGERIKGAYAWRSLLASGATIAAGSDAPVEEVSPLLGIYAAVSRRDRSGAPAGGWMPEQRMTRLEALAAFTRGAAYASFREAEAGRIARDPLAVPEDELPRLQVMLTIVAGTVEFSR